jgi:hypothetical protein
MIECMKAVALSLLIVLLALPLAAQSPTANDVIVALAAVKDATISSVAAYLNTPPLELKGIEVHRDPGESLPHGLTFRRSDVAGYLTIFESTKPVRQNFLSSLLSSAKGPLNDLAIQILRMHQWEQGHAYLDGNATTQWGEGMSLSGLISSVVLGLPIPPIAVQATVTVSGRRVSVPVHVDGVFLVESEAGGYLEITPTNLKINGKPVDGE